MTRECLRDPIVSYTRLTIMVVAATPDDEREFGAEGGG
jgi:hypothetical protein